MKCAKCGTEGDGKFCGECGTPLGEIERPSFCTQCGTAVKGAEQFCTECGASLSAAAVAAMVAAAAPPPPTPRPAPTPQATSGRQPLLKDSSFWMVMSACLLALSAGVVVGKLGGGGEEVNLTPVNASAPGGNAAAVDLNSMTPGQAAERLYTRVVSAAENGDTAQAQQFLPMAIAAHDRAEPLDNDALFHRAILERLAGETAASIASAERILADRPTHLLALASAAEAATDGGDEAAARAYYERFLEAYDGELGQALPEYEAHSQMFPGMRATALLVTGS